MTPQIRCPRIASVDEFQHRSRPPPCVDGDALRGLPGSSGSPTAPRTPRRLREGRGAPRNPASITATNGNTRNPVIVAQGDRGSPAAATASAACRFPRRLRAAPRRAASASPARSGRRGSSPAPAWWRSASVRRVSSTCRPFGRGTSPTSTAAAIGAAAGNRSVELVAVPAGTGGHRVQRMQRRAQVRNAGEHAVSLRQTRQFALRQHVFHQPQALVVAHLRSSGRSPTTCGGSPGNSRRRPGADADAGTEHGAEQWCMSCQDPAKQRRRLCKPASVAMWRPGRCGCAKHYLTLSSLTSKTAATFGGMSRAQVVAPRGRHDDLPLRAGRHLHQHFAHRPACRSG